MKKISLIAALLPTFLVAPLAAADPAPFDLSGPDLRISITRAGVTLPISAVPQLDAGDQVGIEAILPKDETVHYLLVAAFLRDATNPPPNGWIVQSQSWKGAHKGGGPIHLAVPPDARHLVVFLAPETRGGFQALRKAVKDRPGAFVRAAQDLEQASLDHARFDAYVSAIHKLSDTEPESLAKLAPVVAKSLHIKINEDCLQKQSAFQVACLLDARQSVVLGSDGASNGNAVAGAATDLALTLSSTPAGGMGYYSPYISAIHEIIGIFGAMHSPKFQYIPALGVPSGDKLSLMLNTPPSFADPKSVVMVSLPAIKPAELPPVVPMPVGNGACLGVPRTTLPLAVSPLFYATAYARDLKLRLRSGNGSVLDVPLAANPIRGGLVPDVSKGLPANLHSPLAGQVTGHWGFTRMDGPELALQAPGDWQWKPADTFREGRSISLTGASAACVTAVSASDSLSPERSKSAEWKIATPDTISVTLPDIGARPQMVTLTIAGPPGVVPAHVMVAPPAKAKLPQVAVVAHGAAEPTAPAATQPAVMLDNPAEIAADRQLRFTLKISGEGRFFEHDVVELTTVDHGATARLTFGSGLTLLDPNVIVGSFDPGRALGASAFGPLQARLVRDGTAGDWINVGTMVRLPQLERIVCPTDPAKPCTLSGGGLYLLASVAANRDFEAATNVPEGYPGATLAVPHPAVDGTLFVRLHDAPELVNHIAIRSPSDHATHAGDPNTGGPG